MFRVEGLGFRGKREAVVCSVLFGLRACGFGFRLWFASGFKVWGLI